MMAAVFAIMKKTVKLAESTVNSTVTDVLRAKMGLHVRVMVNASPITLASVSRVGLVTPVGARRARINVRGLTA